MKTFLLSIIVFITAIPAVSLAIVIESHVQSSSQSGGVRAENGETVVTGPNNASSQITTRIQANSNGGTSTVQITKTVNGVTETQREEYTVPLAGIQIQARVTPHENPSIQTTIKTNVGIIKSNASTQKDVQRAMRESAMVTQTTMSPHETWLSIVPELVRTFFARIFGSISLFS